MHVKWRRRDEGFTLIELLVTVTILSIISVALVGVLIEYLRNANQTSTRLNESSDQQFVSAYWQQDVSSLGVHTPPSGGAINTAQSIWTTDAGAPSGVPNACTAIANTVVGFAWNDYQAASSTDGTATWTGATVNAAVYFTQTATNSNGTTQYQLWRTRCSGSSTQTTILARYLSARPSSPTCSDSSGNAISCTGSTLPTTVAMTIVIQDRSQAVPASTGYTTTLTAQRRQG